MSCSALPGFLPPLQRRKIYPGFSQTSQLLDNNTSVSRTASCIPKEVIRRMPHSFSGDNASPVPHVGLAPAPLAARAETQAERDMPWGGHHSPKGPVMAAGAGQV